MRIFKVTTNFSGCCKNCFQSVDCRELPENYYFIVIRLKKKVRFDLKFYSSDAGDVNSTFQLAHNNFSFDHHISELTFGSLSIIK